MALTCPHCGKPVAANPVGRWFSRFQCPHCHEVLQFDTRTNVLGAVGSALFFIMAWALLMGGGDDARNAAIVAGVLWALAMGASYAFRGIVKG
jgi:transposase-like protein